MNKEDVIPRAQFVAWGRIGGYTKSKARAAASRRNQKLAIKALKRMTKRKRQLTLRLRTD